MTAVSAELQCVEVHRVWLRFFEELFRVCRNRLAEELALLCHAVGSALHDHRRLCTAPEAFGTRARLCHLALNVLHAAHYPFHTDSLAVSQFVSAASTIVTALPPVVVDGDTEATTFDGDGLDATWPPSMASAFTSQACLIVGALPVVLGEPGVQSTPALVAVGDTAERGGGGGGGADGASVSGQTAKHSLALSGGLVGKPLVAAAAAPEGGRGVSHVRSTATAVRRAVFLDAWSTLTVGSLALLRDRVLRSALAWFELPLSWYEVATSSQRLREDFEFVTGGSSCCSLCWSRVCV